MSFDKPWMLGGGVRHEVEVARLLAYAASGGAEGVVVPGDLKVRPLATPGTKIRVAPGAAVMLNRFPGGAAQSYVARLPIQQEVSVTATGSSGARSDLVVARIEDPQYAGPVPPDVQTFDYARIEIIEGVPASTKSALDLNLNYPAVALARLDLPKNTGTIQASHITDVRDMAQPRKDRHLFVYPINTNDGDIRLNQMKEGGQSWPSTSITKWFVTVPHWAQRVRMLATWGGVLLEDTDERSHGRIWIQLARASNPDAVISQHTSWSIETEQYRNVREAWVGGDDKYVPPGLRGSEVEVFLRGMVKSDNVYSSKPRLDWLSVVSLDLEFYETRS